MLSYRHAFHAGNFADVIKHLVLCRILTYLTRKPGPVCYIETHAGTGMYDLASTEASKTSEFHHGIGLLWQRDDVPEPMKVYRDLVIRANNTRFLSHYPGSPWFAAKLLRQQDRLELCELHPQDFPQLQQHFKSDPRVHCYFEDGFTKSLALTPPQEKRGMVLVDPSYEIKSDYRRAATHLQALHNKFATGTYALWYPLVDPHRTQALELAIKATGIRRIDLYELNITDRHRGHRLTGAGMIVINPPWTLREEMKECLTWLAPLVSETGRPHFRIIEITGE